MISTILQSFRVAEIRKKLLFTAAILALYRLGSYIPVPGINLDAVDAIQQNYANGVLGLLNTFTGGGQARITQFTRYLTVGLAAAQAIGYTFLFRSQSNGAEPVFSTFNVGIVILVVPCLTAGSVVVMWMGELITQRGIGNGISLMIFASIVARLPHGIQTWWTNPDPVFKIIMPFLAIGVVAAVVFIQEGQRRIPIQYAKRVIGRRMSSGGQTYLPLRVNMAGVIPVIFAASIMALPPTLGQLVPSLHGLATFFNPRSWAYIGGETVFIVLFTYFYTAVTFNPVDQADNLRKYGGLK